MNLRYAIEKMRKSTDSYDFCFWYAEVRLLFNIERFNREIAPQILKEFGIEDFELRMVEKE